ncbi:GNAT family N-acetyltransferase [Pseudoroseicyclus tamaricis]|uniref:GNAT family N-acetyltransferase n=1 Tax=Pseudoroseicyclus tamaricis TaxID=2705421 RepID=A0A6B2JPN2_9RHOB|nr:GNAT family protein [Pseudoroseicyclus tamaricis]NDU99914.1 GNAT family N-acetyltransferase [Pseudoroseicyclus tamaricis]
MRPLGPLVEGWSPPPPPDDAAMEGRHCRLERLRPEHGPALWEAFAGHDWLWDYMPSGPFESLAAFESWLAPLPESRDPLFYAVLVDGRPLGMHALLRIAPEAGSIELGHICLSPTLQRSPAATEAMVLPICRAFEAGYRRFEWKCNALNAPSRRAAERLGLSFEGIFRQALVVKGRNRDTAWFAAVDADWPALRAAYETWLSPDNFDASGQQRRRLSTLTAPVLAARSP